MRRSTNVVDFIIVVNVVVITLSSPPPAYNMNTHGRTGTGIPAGGLLRYRKSTTGRCSRHAAVVLSNKGVPQFWEM